jgi:hypothetical protein
MVDIELKGSYLIGIMNPICPGGNSRNILRNGTCLRTMETGKVFRVQRHICRYRRYSFVVRPPITATGSIFLMT